MWVNHFLGLLLVKVQQVLITQTSTIRVVCFKLQYKATVLITQISQPINASYSTLIGYNVGSADVLSSIGSNNIIIGTNISLPSATTNSINLGGVLFARNIFRTCW
jgi:hypothetical protein